MSLIDNKGIFQKQPKFALLGAVLSGLVACGGGGGGGGGDSSDTAKESTAGIMGAEFTGTTTTDGSTANKNVMVKSVSGVSLSATSDSSGKFSSAELKEDSASTTLGPYLVRVEQGNGSYLYSVAYSENATKVDEDTFSIPVNVHPYTNLIIRNWFAVQGLNIDAEFDSAGGIINLPAVSELNAIGGEIRALLSNVLSANNIPSSVDLLSTSFNMGDEFNIFLKNSPIVINNNTINIIANDPVTNLQTIITNHINLNVDFTNAFDSAPSTPQNVRVLPANVSEALIAWEPSTDDKGVAGYRIYRDDVLIATTAFSVYRDTGLQSGSTYGYSIEAIDGRGQLSDRTTETMFALSAADTIAPPTASQLQGTADDSGIHLVWSQSNINDVAAFKVLRGPAGNVNTPVAAITSTQFTDFSVAEGTTYCYRVITIDGAGNESAASDESCAAMGGIVAANSTLGFSASTYTVSESSASVIVTVNRLGDVSTAASVKFSASSGTATSGEDFIETSGTLSWIATDSSAKTFTVQINADTATEPNETVVLNLSDASGALLGDVSTATLTITDAQVTCVDLVTTTIKVNTTLSSPCYNVDKTITISDAATLTINPGVRLVFAAGTGLEAEDDGVLKAIGTAAQPIIFTGELQAAGYWDGIRIYSIATSQIAHAVIEYGGGSSYYTDANVHLFGSGKLSLTDSIIRHGGGYGFSSMDSSSNLIAFSGNTVTLNEKSPVLIAFNHVGRLPESSTYKGNQTINGGDRDYIEITGTLGLTTDQRWNKLDVKYRMPATTTNMWVDAKLTLAPGIRLEFPANTMLEVRAAGTLIAVGTEESPIVFTGLEATPGFWRGIQFTFNGNANELDHAIVEYGGGAGSNTLANVGVYGSNGRLSIKNSVLQYSAANGFYFYSGIALTMDAVMITGNAVAGRVEFNDVGKLSGTSFYTGNTDDRIVVVGTTPIKNALTMKNLGVPYYISTDRQTTVDAGLTIEPGTELQFASGGGFNVSQTGTLIAQGTASAPIIFTGTQKTKGFWNGFQFTFSNNPNLIDHAVVEYAGAVYGNTQALIGFYGTTGLPTLGTVSNTVMRASLTNAIELSMGTTGSFSTGNTYEDIDGQNIKDPRP